MSRAGVTVRTSDQLTDRLKLRLLRRYPTIPWFYGYRVVRLLIKNILRHPAQVARGVSCPCTTPKFCRRRRQNSCRFSSLSYYAAIGCLSSKAIEAHLCPSSATAFDVVSQPARLVSSVAFAAAVKPNMVSFFRIASCELKEVQSTQCIVGDRSTFERWPGIARCCGRIAYKRNGSSFPSRLAPVGHFTDPTLKHHTVTTRAVPSPTGIS